MRKIEIREAPKMKRQKRFLSAESHMPQDMLV